MITLEDESVRLAAALQKNNIDPEEEALSRPIPARYLLPSVWERTNARRYGEKLEGIPTGLQPLDIALRGGWQDGFTYLIAALQGAGKTNFLSYFSWVAAQFFVDEGLDKAVVFFEQEMMARELVERWTAMRSGVSALYIALGGVYNKAGEKIRPLTDEEYLAWYTALDEMTALPLRIQQGALTVVNMEKAVKRLAAEGKQVGIVFDDYLGLHPTSAGSSNYDSTSRNAREIRQMTLRMLIPVVVAHQPNRTVHNSEDKRLQMQHLAGSGQIEAYMTHLLFWNNGSCLLPRDQQPEEAEGDIDIAKNRTGWLTRIPMNMHMPTGLPYLPRPAIDGDTGEILG